VTLQRAALNVHKTLAGIQFITHNCWLIVCTEVARVNSSEGLLANPAYAVLAIASCGKNAYVLEEIAQERQREDIIQRYYRQNTESSSSCLNYQLLEQRVNGAAQINTGTQLLLAKTERFRNSCISY